MASPLNQAELSCLASLLRSANQEQLKDLDQAQIYESLTGIKWNPLWNPLPGPQTKAFTCEADELFFGGGGGGGKTELGIGLAITAHRKTLFLRRESVQLEAIVQRLKDICGQKGAWKSSGP